jgi:hypothetical protein
MILSQLINFRITSFLLVKHTIKSIYAVLAILLIGFSNQVTAQTLQLGTLSSFEAYTGSGAVTNNGTASGDAGTNDGIISGVCRQMNLNFSGQKIKECLANLV